MNDVLSERIEKLERANSLLIQRLELAERATHRMKRFAGVVVLCVIVAVVGGAKLADKPAVVEAEKFVVSDRQGKVRAVLAYSEEDVSSLSLYDRAGKVRVKVAVTDYDFDDLGGKGRLGDFSGMDVFDKNGKLRAAMKVSPWNVLQFDVLDGAEKSRFDLAVDGAADGVAQMHLCGSEKPGIQTYANADGSLNMNFFDHDRQSCLSLGIKKDGTQYIDTNDQQDNRRFQLQTKPDGSAFVRILDKDGTPLFEAPKP